MAARGTLSLFPLFHVFAPRFRPVLDADSLFLRSPKWLQEKENLDREFLVKLVIPGCQLSVGNGLNCDDDVRD